MILSEVQLLQYEQFEYSQRYDIHKPTYFFVKNNRN